jgi:hypothetical protein
MKKKTKSKLDPVEGFLGLSDAQKDAEVARFDSEIDPAEWKPLTPSQRKRWDKIRMRLRKSEEGHSTFL